LFYSAKEKDGCEIILLIYCSNVSCSHHIHIRQQGNETYKSSSLQCLLNDHKHSRGRWGTVDTFLNVQPLLLYFKSKQAQNLLHNKATLYTQYHAKT